MNLRKSKKNDIPAIIKMIGQAQEYLKINNIDQWQNGYPNRDIIEKDIINNESYILEANGKIVASAAISFRKEPSYNKIYDGKWLSKQAYAVIHRVVVDSAYKGKGISSEILKDVEDQCLQRDVHSIKVDTHPDNLSMQKLLKKNDYIYCGKIFLEDGSLRVAYEKLI